MKKKLVLTAAVIAALSVGSCNSKKTNAPETDQDSLSYAEKIRLIQTTLYSTLLQVLTREHFPLPTVLASRPC